MDRGDPFAVALFIDGESCLKPRVRGCRLPVRFGGAKQLQLRGLSTHKCAGSVVEEPRAIVDAKPCQRLPRLGRALPGAGLEAAAALIGEKTRGLMAGCKCGIDRRKEKRNVRRLVSRETRSGAVKIRLTGAVAPGRAFSSSTVAGVCSTSA